MSRLNSLYQSKLTTESQRTSAFSQSIATPQGKTSQISNIIECPICTESIRHSHMCPWCCKLFCEPCIKNWIKSKKQECPHCSKPLNSANLLNCSMLGRQIEQALSKSVSKIKNTSNSTSVMVSPSGTKIVFPKPPTPNYESPFAKQSELICDRHQLKLDYFCQKCLVGMCSDCAVLTKNHLGHKICKISHKKLQFKELRLELQAELTQRKSNFTRERDQLKLHLDRSPTIENQKQIILSSYLNHLAIKNCQLHDQALELQTNKYNNRYGMYAKQIMKLDSLSRDIEKQGKAALVRTSSFIQNQLVEAISCCCIQPQTSLRGIEGFIVPEYHQKTYILEDYNYLRLKGDILISEPLYIKNTEWRLKIFPAGLNKNSQDQHLSIHLQMSKGFETFNWYRFRIELVNQTNRSKCVSIEFDNEFKEGSQQCIDNFILISKLFQENFIHPELGHIEIVLYVRCMTYYHAIRDQNELIKYKQSKISNNLQTISNLKREAASKGFKLNKEITSPNQYMKEHQLSASNCSPVRKVMAIDGDELVP